MEYMSKEGYESLVAELKHMETGIFVRVKIVILIKRHLLLSVENVKRVTLVILLLIHLPLPLTKITELFQELQQHSVDITPLTI